MSLFKKFANYCRKVNERDRIESERSSDFRAARIDAELKRKEEERKRCCLYCTYYSGGMCMHPSHYFVDIFDSENKVCRDFKKDKYM